MKGLTIVKIQDHLDKKWKDILEGIDIYYEGDNTVILLNIKDEAHLHGILNLIRDLNLRLISINAAEQ